MVMTRLKVCFTCVVKTVIVDCRLLVYIYFSREIDHVIIMQIREASSVRGGGCGGGRGVRGV